MNSRPEAFESTSPVGWLANFAADLLADNRGGRELREAESHFRSLLDSLPVNLLVKDAEGRRVFANRDYLHMRQAALEDVLGKTDFDLFPEALAKKYQRDDREVLETGRVMHSTEQHESPGSEQGRWIESVKGPIRDTDGQIVGVLILFWDVTAHRQAELQLARERNLLRALMDNIPDAIYFKDRESRFLQISRAMADKCGLATPEDAVGKSDADIFTEEHAKQALADEREIMRTGQPMVARLEKETWPDREDTWVSTTKMPLRDTTGRIVGTFGISRDITELKRTQDALREARDAATAASRAKSDFLANMSHEIRTPMNAIIGMTELLLDTGLTTTQHDYMRMVQQSGDSLLALLNDILDFSKIEAGKLELERAPFDPRECLGDTMKSLALRAHGKGLELAFSIDSNVPYLLEGDVGRLRQVVVNLVGNAIKFTEHGEVLLDVQCSTQSDDRATLLVAVRDTGIGIPQDQQERIFDEFQQADTSTTRTYGGTGLGLAIATRLVQLMDGRIWVESEPGLGSTFFFTAEFGLPDIAPDDRHGRRRVVVSDTPVLIVDDNATNRRILFDMLSNWGMKPTLATNAREAFGHLQQAMRQGTPFELVLSDVNMPEVDGFEMVSWIRDDLLVRETPVIMLTSAGRPGDNDRRLALNIATHLLKPVKQSELFDAVVTVLGVATADVADDSEASSALPQLDGVRVLLAEDNVVNQKLAVGVLEKLGCEVTVAENGRRAITCWQKGQFDMVLMDVQMPEMDGFEATQAIRQAEQSSGGHTPIIAMTAHAMSGDRERCLEAGMDDYLPKPVRIGQLAEKLQSHLQLDGAQTPDAETATAGTDGLVDWADALEACGGDRSLLRLVIDAFLEESKTLIRDLQNAVQQRNAALLKSAAHSMKGILLSVGARRIASGAFELERAGAAGEIDSSQPTLDKLCQDIERLSPLLEKGPPA